MSPRTHFQGRDVVITLTRLGGSELALNPDLMERAEATPDTVITMVDGHKIVVSETLTEVVDRIREWRASVAARAYGLSRSSQVLDDIEYVEELAAEDVTGRIAGPAHIAQVLRLPRREE